MPNITTHTFTAVVHKEEDLYVADCVELGVTSQGESIEESLESLQEAVEVYLEEFPEKLSELEHNSRPLVTTFEAEVKLAS